MRLWSSENYKCLEEYSLSDLAPLVDFDFDESKVEYKTRSLDMLLMNSTVEAPNQCRICQVIYKVATGLK